MRAVVSVKQCPVSFDKGGVYSICQYYIDIVMGSLETLLSNITYNTNTTRQEKKEKILA